MKKHKKRKNKLSAALPVSDYAAAQTTLHTDALQALVKLHEPSVVPLRNRSTRFDHLPLRERARSLVNFEVATPLIVSEEVIPKLPEWQRLNRSKGRSKRGSR